jgi:type III secretory pathway component EscT
MPSCTYVLLIFKFMRLSMILPFFTTKEFHSSPLNGFILPSYVEAQAQVLASRVSPPRVKNLFLYDHAI